MRQSIAIAGLVALSAIAADASAQSRYGPRPTASAQEEAIVNLPPEALLNWKGKPPIAAQPAAAQVQAPQRPEPVAAWSQRMAAITPPPPRALPEPASVTVNPPAPPPQARPAPLPASLYDPPAPQPRAAPQSPVPVPAPAPVAERQPAPQPVAPSQRPAPAPPQTALLGAPKFTSAHPNAIDPASLPPPNPGPRFYSVFREYGVAPDQIPVSPNLGRADEVQLKEIPSTPTLSSPDDTQYLPPRTNQSEAAANRTF